MLKLVLGCSPQVGLSHWTGDAIELRSAVRQDKHRAGLQNSQSPARVSLFTTNKAITVRAGSSTQWMSETSCFIVTVHQRKQEAVEKKCFCFRRLHKKAHYDRFGTFYFLFEAAFPFLEVCSLLCISLIKMREIPNYGKSTDECFRDVRICFLVSGFLPEGLGLHRGQSCSYDKRTDICPGGNLFTSNYLRSSKGQEHVSVCETKHITLAGIPHRSSTADDSE